MMAEIGKSEIESSSVALNDVDAHEDDILAFEDHPANANALDVVGAPSFHSNFM